MLAVAALLLAGCGDAAGRSAATTRAATLAHPSPSTGSTGTGSTGSPGTGSAGSTGAVTTSRFPPESPPVVVRRGDGELAVVPGGSAPVGEGPLRTYVVEVEGGLGIDPVVFARAVDRTLADPRSWTSGGRRTLQRVDGDAHVRVALASPETVDRLCAPLRTVGRLSCANGDRAVLNAARWLTGAPTYAGALEAYRDYLVNHEVGHVLGFRHTGCPGPGEVAPVMLQQTLGLRGCRQGPWPYP